MHDSKGVSVEALPPGVEVEDLNKAAGSDILVLAVPVQRMEALLKQLAPLLAMRKTPALVLDVASVKARPVALMRDLLPPQTEIIGTHPLFGPQSGKDGIAGFPIALCPVRVGPESLTCVRSFLSGKLGLKVIDVDPEEHDRLMAYVQGLTHLISRAVGEMPLPHTELATAAYRRFLDMRGNLAGDSWDLFVTIERENPFAPDVRRQLREKLEEIEQRLNSGGR
ncbi:MAG: prephenate dehydrogenase [Phycisphaerales bacterium]